MDKPIYLQTTENVLYTNESKLIVVQWHIVSMYLSACVWVNMSTILRLIKRMTRSQVYLQSSVKTSTRLNLNNMLAYKCLIMFVVNNLVKIRKTCTLVHLGYMYSLYIYFKWFIFTNNTCIKLGFKKA